MSEIKVNSIKGVGASVAALSINNSDGTCTANLSNRQGKNLIINGGMIIAQRGLSSTSNLYQTVDRMAIVIGGTDENPTQAQVDVAAGTTPYSLGFRKAFKVTNGNQTGGLGTTDIIEALRYRLEAQDIANSGWNYTDSNSFITLSFWVKSSVSFNMKGYFFTQDNTYNYPLETGTLSANTWTKIIRTIPGNSNLVFNNDNGHGLTISWGVYGTNYSSGNPPVNQWVDYSAATLTNPSETTWYTTNDATLEFTGLQLEVSDHASDFQFRSFAEELSLCQRYYQVIAEGTNKAICNAVSFAGNDGFGFIDLKSVMRAAPTLDVVTGTGYWRAFRNAGVGDFNDVIMESNSNRTVGLKFQGVSSGTSLSTGQVGFIRTNNSAAFLAASSEL